MEIEIRIEKSSKVRIRVRMGNGTEVFAIIGCGNSRDVINER